MRAFNRPERSKGVLQAECNGRGDPEAGEGLKHSQMDSEVKKTTNLYSASARDCLWHRFVREA